MKLEGTAHPVWVTLAPADCPSISSYTTFYLRVAGSACAVEGLYEEGCAPVFMCSGHRVILLPSKHVGATLPDVLSTAGALCGALRVAGEDAV